MPHLIDDVVERTGYRRTLLESGETDADERLENLRELRGVATQAADVPAAESLAPFLENVALVSDQDTLEGDQQQYLTLITLHQIKGLEYAAVFMVGMEEGVLPHSRAAEDPDQLEEERRIAYVGMTRAKDRLYLYRSFRRRLFGTPQANPPSRFLRSIPEHLIQVPGKQKQNNPAIAYDRWSTPVSPPSGPVDAPFNAGDKVSHDSFGQGIVVSCNPSGADFEVTVAFVGASGIKRLMHSFANLQRAESTPS
jgi:DNA helicase-2/ATP-dependent DNA helicase PcrA